MKTRHSSFARRLALALLALPTAAFADSVSTWRVSGDIDGYGQDNVQVCLFNSGGAPGWESLSLDSAGSDCQELVVFDRQSHLIYIAFPGAINASAYHCGSRVQIAGRHPCNSAFFVGNTAGQDRRTLDRARLKNALVDSGAMAMADQMIAADQEAYRASCQKRLDAAGSVQGVQEVMGACEAALGDTGKSQANAMIDRIQTETKLESLAAYRNEFEAASRSSDSRRLEVFIDRYVANDPDRLVPKARATLDRRREREAVAAAEAKRKLAIDAERRAAVEAEERKLRIAAEAEARKLRAAEEAEAKRRRLLAQLEGKISTCKSAKASAAEVKAREQAISAETGYTNPGTLRSAAAVEFDCNKSIKENYRRYQELGGTKSLRQID